MKNALISLALAAALAACTQVPESQYADATADPKIAANGEELICERVPIPGKIYPGKICMTEAQWAQHKESGRKSTDDIQKNSLRTPVPGQGS